MVKSGVQDIFGPAIRLQPLSKADIQVLLQRLAEIASATIMPVPKSCRPRNIQGFLDVLVSRVGADALLTPGEIVRDLMTVLNILQQNPQLSLEQVLQGSNTLPSATLASGKSTKAKPADEDNQFAGNRQSDSGVICRRQSGLFDNLILQGA